MVLEEALPPLSFQGPELFGIDPMLLTEQNTPFNPTLPVGADIPQPSAGQLIDLGLFEQLPSFDLIDEL